MKEKTQKNKVLIMWLVIVLVVAGIAYYAGDKHGQSIVATNASQSRGGFGGAGGKNRFGPNGGMVSGSVISKDDTSITVKMRDGSSKIVLYSGTTQIMKSAAGTIADIIVGSNVSVQGNQNSDGSVTSQTISLRPNMPSNTNNPQTTTGQ